MRSPVCFLAIGTAIRGHQTSRACLRLGTPSVQTLLVLWDSDAADPLAPKGQQRHLLWASRVTASVNLDAVPLVRYGQVRPGVTPLGAARHGLEVLQETEPVQLGGHHELLAFDAVLEVVEDDGCVVLLLVGCGLQGRDAVEFVHDVQGLDEYGMSLVEDQLDNTVQCGSPLEMTRAQHGIGVGVLHFVLHFASDRQQRRPSLVLPCVIGEFL